MSRVTARVRARLRGSRQRVWSALVALALDPDGARAQTPETPIRSELDVRVTAPRVVPGAGVEAERIPSAVQTIERDALDGHVLEPLGRVLADEVPGASWTDTQGSLFNATLDLRGFTASPVLGAPQGVAVFQDGVRVNDPFGDVVHWALLPDFAIERIHVLPGAHPVFGPNALGGAVALETKSGFGAPGARLSVEAGSQPAGGGSAEWGGARGGLAAYGGVRVLHDEGWRDASPASLLQGFARLGARGDAGELDLSIALAHADFTGNGPAPRELLDEDVRAIFTEPDRSEDRLLAATLRGRRPLGDTALLHARAYVRATDVGTVNGDEADFEACEDGASAGFLCSESADGEALLVDRDGRPVPAGVGADGARNETRTRSRATGGALELSDERPLFGRENRASLGVSADLGFADYRARSRAGRLTDSREVESLGFYLGGEDWNTRLATTNQHWGAYLTDTFSPTQAIAVTAAARLDVARIDLDDLRGADLNGDHAFVRVSPSLGVTWQATPSLGLFARYAEAQRAPTAAELACADPERACRVPNAFTADPPLDAVVSRGVEVGARGGREGALALGWSAAAWATWNEDDILFVASGPVLGSGYFTNAGRTRRIGFDAQLDARWRSLRGWLRYGFVHATFESGATFLSPHHPEADADGRIAVRRGDRLPNLPRHALRAGLWWDVLDAWAVGADASLVSGRFHQGDEANALGAVPGYAIFGIETRLRLAERLHLTFRVDNLLDREYAVAGALGDAEEVLPGFDDPRFQTPGRPRTFEGSLRFEF